MKTNSGFWQPCNSTCGCPILISDYTSNKHRYRNTIWCVSHTYILCMNWYLLYPTNWLLLSVDTSLKRFWLSVICKNEDKFNFVELICLNERWKTESIQYFSQNTTVLIFFHHSCTNYSFVWFWRLYRQSLQL